MPNEHRNIKPIGGGFLEATCKTCGAVFLLAAGDDFFCEVDAELAVWPLCSKCYDGPRGTRKQVGDLLGRRKGEDMGDRGATAVG